MSDSPTSTPPQTGKPYDVYTREYEIIFTPTHSTNRWATTHRTQAINFFSFWGFPEGYLPLYVYFFPVSY